MAREVNFFFQPIDESADAGLGGQILMKGQPETAPKLLADPHGFQSGVSSGQKTGQHANASASGDHLPLGRDGG